MGTNMALFVHLLIFTQAGAKRNNPDDPGRYMYSSLLAEPTRPTYARIRWRFTGAYLDFAARFIYQSRRFGYVLTHGTKCE